MKLKTPLSITIFVLAFLISFFPANYFKTQPFPRSFNLKQNSQARAKIYAFLLKDKQLSFELSEKLESVEQPNRISVIKLYYEKRQKQDVSQLPEDFQYAWEKVILNDIEWVNFTFHLQKFNGDAVIETKAQKELATTKIENGKRLDEEMRSVARTYGIEFDEFGNLTEK